LKPTVILKTFTIIPTRERIVIYLTSSCVDWAFFGMSEPV
jgi:hypothetical protein